MTRKFRKHWSDTAFTQSQKDKGKVCSTPLERLLLVLLNRLETRGEWDGVFALIKPINRDLTKLSS